jgi:hypothetical protein
MYVTGDKSMASAVLEVPTTDKVKTYNELLLKGLELGAKCNPGESEANRLSYRASWLGTLAATGWTEGQWFKAGYSGTL